MGLHIMREWGQYVCSTLSLLPQGEEAHGDRRDDKNIEGLRCLMLVKATPGKEDARRDILRRHKWVSYEDVFGPYDCVLEFQSSGPAELQERVRGLRKELGETIVQTITMLKFPIRVSDTVSF